MHKKVVFSSTFFAYPNRRKMIQFGVYKILYIPIPFSCAENHLRYAWMIKKPRKYLETFVTYGGRKMDDLLRRSSRIATKELGI